MNSLQKPTFVLGRGLQCAYIMSIKTPPDLSDRIRDHEHNRAKKKYRHNYIPIPSQSSHACQEGHNLKSIHLEEKSNENKLLNGYCEHHRVCWGDQPSPSLQIQAVMLVETAFMPNFAFSRDWCVIGWSERIPPSPQDRASGLVSQKALKEGE
jgi:hypothetical protein